MGARAQGLARAFVAPQRATERHFLLPMAPVTNNQHSVGRSERPQGPQSQDIITAHVGGGQNSHYSFQPSPFFMLFLPENESEQEMTLDSANRYNVSVNHGQI